MSNRFAIGDITICKRSSRFKMARGTILLYQPFVKLIPRDLLGGFAREFARYRDTVPLIRLTPTCGRVHVHLLRHSEINNGARIYAVCARSYRGSTHRSFYRVCSLSGNASFRVLIDESQVHPALCKNTFFFRTLIPRRLDSLLYDK